VPIARIAVLSLLLFACSSTTPAPPPAAATQTVTDQTEAITWLTDEQGRDFYVEKVPRVEHGYSIVDANHVRIHYGLTHEFIRYDDEFFYVKIYRTLERQKPPPSGPPDPAIAKSYIPETKEGDVWEARRVEGGLPSQGQWRNGFAIGDINGDGFLDLVSGPPRSSVRRLPRILVNDGRARFQTPAGTMVPAAPYDYGDAEIGDFDGNGVPDIALAAHLGDIIVLLAQDDGSYRMEKLPLPNTVPQKPLRFSSRTLAIVDWNSDGRPELLALSEGPAMQGARAEPGSYAGGKVLYTRGVDGIWKTQIAAVTDSTFGDALVIADFNGDKRPDFAASSSRPGDRSIINLHEPDDSWTTKDLAELRPGSLVGSLAAFDFNGDARSDLAVGYQALEGGIWRSGVDLLIAGDGTWQRRTLWSTEGREGVFSMAAGDLDGDGQTDLVAGTGEGRIVPFRRSGDEFIREKPVAAGVAGCRGYDLEVADLDQDGVAELISAFAGEKCPDGGAMQIWKITRKKR
jgi:hypothetical protein